jgi:3-hydroxyacyl-CoA dehydrogenase
VKQGVLGRKSGRGFYLYDPANKKGANSVNQDLVAPLLSSSPPKSLNAEKIQWRLMLIMANEAARVLEQRVASSAEAIDLSVLLGLGMGQFRGGLMRWCDSVGLANIVERLRELANTLGHRFEPSPLLVELSRSNRPLSEYRR